MKRYPGKVCYKCAYSIKKVKSIGAITVYKGTCDVCQKNTTVSTPGDYGWPDFPGFKKVKRQYVWD